MKLEQVVKRKYYRQHIQGVGLSLSHSHVKETIEASEKLSWVEASYEHFACRHSLHFRNLKELRKKLPFSLSGTALSFEQGRLSQQTLTNLKNLVGEFEPSIINVPLSWNENRNYVFRSDLPLSFNSDQIERCAEEIDYWQSELGAPIVFENKARYLNPKDSDLTEIDFINRLLNESDSFLCLNLTNVAINCHYNGDNPETFIKSINPHRVQQIALTAKDSFSGYFSETHNDAVWNLTWKLYWPAKSRFEKAATLVRWKDNIENFTHVLHECEKAKRDISGNLYETPTLGDRDFVL